MDIFIKCFYLLPQKAGRFYRTESLYLSATSVYI